MSVAADIHAITRDTRDTRTLKRDTDTDTQETQKTERHRVLEIEIQETPTPSKRSYRHFEQQTRTAQEAHEFDLSRLDLHPCIVCATNCIARNISGSDSNRLVSRRTCSLVCGALCSECHNEYDRDCD